MSSGRMSFLGDDVVEGADQGSALGIGADGDSEGILEASGVEVAHEDVLFAQGEEDFFGGGGAVPVGEDEVGLGVGDLEAELEEYKKN